MRDGIQPGIAAETPEFELHQFDERLRGGWVRLPGAVDIRLETPDIRRRGLPERVVNETDILRQVDGASDELLLAEETGGEDDLALVVGGERRRDVRTGENEGGGDDVIGKYVRILFVPCGKIDEDNG
jgi:hypothetical protein